MAPSSIAAGIPITETKASRQGIHYIAANGSQIQNEGEKRISGTTESGSPVDMIWQIAGVKKPLASVGRMCDAGHVAIFTKEGEYIIGREGANQIMSIMEKKERGVLRMMRENRVYNFRTRVPASGGKKGIQL